MNEAIAFRIHLAIAKALPQLKPLNRKVSAETRRRLALLVRLARSYFSKRQRVYVYHPGVAVECLDNPASVSGDPVLPGFVLDLSKIW